MMPGALVPYEFSLSSAGGLSMLADDGTSITLEIERYLQECDGDDESVLARCVGPVLDIGCGPGRIVGALRDRGVAALGVDIAATAVQLTRTRGAAAVHRDIFSSMPAEGRWTTAVVLDGNVGIGGDVDRLLRRVGQLLAVGGRAIIETAVEPDADESKRLRFASDGVGVGPLFPWAIAGASTVVAKARRAGLELSDQWSAGGRSFVELVVPAASGIGAEGVDLARSVETA